MNYKFEELPITVNGRKFLVDGVLEIESVVYWNEDGIIISEFYLTRVTDEEGYRVSVTLDDFKSIKEEVETEFYSADSKLYDDALTCWSER